MEGFGELRKAVDSIELIDAHAHNIAALDSAVPFVTCFSEATGTALSQVPYTLSFKRSLRDISELYGIELSLDSIEEYRNRSGLESISTLCFKAAKISAILIDDGIELDKKLDLEWHQKFSPFIGRILRIERLAEKILDEGNPEGTAWTLDAFMGIFLGNLNTYPLILLSGQLYIYIYVYIYIHTHTYIYQLIYLKIHKFESICWFSYRFLTVIDKVVGFKSIAAYRSGLEINTNVTRKEAEEGLLDSLQGYPVRITNKNFIDFIFLRSLEVASCFDLPMQIHTGFGDNDLDLRLANPLHLRNLLEDKRFCHCRLVLLHASYPFSRESSYLASVYPQVYLDFGLAVPKLSVHGMITAVKELLELAPTKKVMFSSDGITFPEAFYLGAKRAREVVFSVLRDACIDGDLSIPEAVEAIKDIFAGNAKQFYKLNVAVKSFDLSDVVSPKIVKAEETIATSASQQDDVLLRIIWVDTSGQHRCRVVLAKRFHDSVKKNGVGLTFACMGMTSYTDGPADGTNLTGVGEIRLIPDLSTQCKIPWLKQEEMVLADMQIKPGEAWEYCPREALRRVSKILKDKFNLVMNAGFENEFYLLKSVMREGKEEWVPFDQTPYCSTSAFDAASPILHEVISGLQSLNIPVEQLHAESGCGQFEIALGYTACSTAADRLIYAREVIRAVSRKHGLLATFVPKYALDDIGSGSHVHISLSKDGENVFMGSDESSRYGMSKIGEEFMAGVLHHLPSILAFTAPVPNSYDRIQPNTWSGAYQCWGKENREAPIRTASPPGVAEGVVSNFEIKAFDGCANPYLGLASIIAAGIDGLNKHLSLPEPIDENPHDLSTQLQRLPKSLSESVEALEKDMIMEELIGKKLLIAVKGVRKAEIQYYAENIHAYKKLIRKY